MFPTVQLATTTSEEYFVAKKIWKLVFHVCFLGARKKRSFPGYNFLRCCNYKKSLNSRVLSHHKRESRRHPEFEQNSQVPIISNADGLSENDYRDPTRNGNSAVRCKAERSINKKFIEINYSKCRSWEKFSQRKRSLDANSFNLSEFFFPTRHFFWKMVSRTFQESLKKY